MRDVKSPKVFIHVLNPRPCLSLNSHSLVYVMRALGSGRPRGTSGEEKERVHSGCLYSLSVAHLIPSMVSYWNVTGSGKLGDCKCPPTMTLQATGQKDVTANTIFGCSCNSEEALWQVSGTLCCVMVEGAGSWLQALVKILQASCPAVRSAVGQKLDFPFTSSTLIILSQRLMCSSTIIGHKPSYSLDCT